MIKFENTEVFNFEGALRGMRNPLNSWGNTDSYGVKEERIGDITKDFPDGLPAFVLGKNDLALAQRLIKAGSDHRKFMRQILVSVDITAPLYWWKEFDTYKVGTVANSCSTMHTIHTKEFTLGDFSIDNFNIRDDVYIREDNKSDSEVWLSDCIVNMLLTCEALRKKYLETKDKKYWRALIQLLPESYNQKRTVTFNYEVLRNIRGSRHNHKLDEWSVGFMEWIDSLPYADELIKYGG